VNPRDYEIRTIGVLANTLDEALNALDRERPRHADLIDKGVGFKVTWEFAVPLDRKEA